jgi:recombinational DNA repair ATPase RecF
VIKLETVHIEEVRGIRKLDIDFQRSTFAISGPNGSGKSGVIDAIEFGLTGQISRLTGRGTKGLSIAEHGPHVDKVKFPDAAYVTLKLQLTDIGKSVTITRKLKNPSKPVIEPATEEVKRILAEIADHPEITLSRREILRFILVEPTKRSEEIQSLLKLDEIGQTRSTLNTALNKLQTAQRATEGAVTTAREALQRHAQIATLRADDLLEPVNKRRKTLELEPFEKLSTDTKLDLGIDAGAKPTASNKQSALNDFSALSAAVSGLDSLAKKEAAALVAALGKLSADPALFTALKRLSFIEKGLELVDGPECPLCDKEWDSAERLADHLRAKLVKSQEAQKLQQTLLENGAAVGRAAGQLSGLLASAQHACEGQGEAALVPSLKDWKTDLDALKTSLTSLEGIADAKARLASGWPRTPAGVPAELATAIANVTAKPDQTAMVEAQTFLTTAQLRLSDYRESMRKVEAAKLATAAARVAYDTYCTVLEDELNGLYEEVQKDFSTFYRAVNQDDEGAFTAKLTPTEGGLGLDVNFYDRGLFPPAAYHSEGHQDGMGVCLYLALMKRLFGERFTFALLDDVVMSVDADHRYQFCKLLKEHFPNTQFVITTHDRLWAEQMKSTGLVSGRTSLSFHSWTVDTGPLVESNREIWDEIAAALDKGKVEVAAPALRRHLEYVSRHLADQIAASPPFRADGNYELGVLLPSVLKRLKDLYGRAAEAAQSWGNAEDREAAVVQKSALSTCNGAMSVEQWAVNKAVHYNAWANFGKKDFQPVVIAFKELLDCFRCKSCDSWLHVSPRANPETLRCACNKVNFNLKHK